MITKSLAAAVLCLCFAQVGCAASSNGGGLVVGNPIISASTAKNMKDSTCDCADSKDTKVKAACKCATDAKSKKACADDDKTCKR